MMTQASLDKAFSRRQEKKRDQDRKYERLLQAVESVEAEAPDSNKEAEDRIEAEAIRLNVYLSNGIADSLPDLLRIANKVSYGDMNGQRYPSSKQPKWLRNLLLAKSLLSERQPQRLPRLYQTYHDLLLARGRLWRQDEAMLYDDLPEDIKDAPVQSWSYDIERGKGCYESAAEMAARRVGLEYCEGWAKVRAPDGAMVIAHHGWTYDPSEDVVVDTHWPVVAEEYFGIVFPFEYVQETMERARTYGLLGVDPENGYDLLTRGVPGRDYTSKAN